MTSQDRIHWLLARERRLESAPEAVIARTARQASSNAPDAELLIRCADGCSSQAKDYRHSGWAYRASALEKLAMRLQEAAS
jgi:hypothetical protein